MNEHLIYKVVQIIKPGTVDMIPPMPSLLDLALFQPKPKPEKAFRPGYRHSKTGDGICAICMQPKKNEEFATPAGYQCKECKNPNGRGMTKNKRVKK